LNRHPFGWSSKQLEGNMSTTYKWIPQENGKDEILKKPMEFSF
jgi:hypothetical protein